MELEPPGLSDTDPRQSRNRVRTCLQGNAPVTLADGSGRPTTDRVDHAARDPGLCRNSAEAVPPAVVRAHPRIIDVPARKLELLVSDEELEARRKLWKKPRPHREDSRGYRKLFMAEVTQADRGCDFEFLAPPLTVKVPRSSR